MTLALNSPVEPAQIDTLPGDKLICAWGAVIVTLAELEALASTKLVAVIVTVAGLGTIPGAM